MLSSSENSAQYRVKLLELQLNLENLITDLRQERKMYGESNDTYWADKSSREDIADKLQEFLETSLKI